MASSPTQPQSPPRKRARLSLKQMRKEQQPTVPEEPAESSDSKQSNDAVDETQPQPMYPEPSEPQPSTSCIPSEYVYSVPPYTGLHNLGNTCYLNSVLQVLRYCPGFAENLDRLSEVVSTVLNVKEDEDADDDCHGDEKSRRRRKEFINQLRLVHKLNKLFKTMSEKEQSYIERMMPSGHELAMYPEDILEAIRDLNPMFKGYLQHDAQELLCCILSNVQEACQGMYAQQQPSQQVVGGMSANSSTADPSTSDSSMKAVRKLDMGTGDGASAEEKMDCGRLLGGGRSRSARGLSHVKLVEEGCTNGGLMKHKETNCPKGIPNKQGTKGLTNGHMHGDHSENHCNGTDLKSKKAVGKLIGSQAGSISPSSDSVRRRGARKSTLTNGHLSGKESNGLDAAEKCPVENGAGDAGSSKKKRLGMGRFVTFQQTSLLSKFGIVKKDKSHHADEEESKDLNDLDQEKNESSRGAQPETVSAPSTALKSQNTTSNNSNSPDQSLSLTCESVPFDSEHLKVVAEEKVYPGTRENEAMSSRTEKEQQMDVTVGAGDELTPAVEEKLAQPVEDAAASSDVSALDDAAQDGDMKLVERMFQGTLALRTRCLECESCSEKREDFQDVSVPVQSIPVSTNDEDQEDPTPDVNPRNLSLSWALSEFTSVERLTDDNKYFCDKCFQKTEAERSVLFGRLPGVLIIQLKRFSAFINCFSPGGSVSKVNDHLAIPQTLSLARWCSQSCLERNRIFELSAIVAHSGSSSSSGHYVAFTKVPQRNSDPGSGDVDSTTEASAGDVWANFDDDRVSVMTEDDFATFLNPLPGQDTAATPYLLMYRQLPTTEMAQT